MVKHKQIVKTHLMGLDSLCHTKYGHILPLNMELGEYVADSLCRNTSVNILHWLLKEEHCFAQT